ncbi:MAG TPA: ATP-binding protein, partial [Burkholderiaceae bacterium]
DYGIRFLAIGLFAWFGARWLSEPIRRLAAASEELGRGLGNRSAGPNGLARAPAPQLDASRGTLEVRQTAQVFNAMAQRLHEQFEAQDLLMAAISHDLRTPLARMRVRLEAMAPPAQAERCIVDVQEMNQLIGSVLEMMRGRQADGMRQRLDLGALAQSQVDDLAEQGLPASMAGLPEVPALVLAQPQALSRVLGNLIGNALRHGGSARVAVHAADDAVRVTIDDDGPGIAPHLIDAVFAPFRRAATGDAALNGGAGLGLYIARDLAERDGGRLTLANRVEGGLRAELVLPRARGD